MYPKFGAIQKSLGSYSMISVEKKANRGIRTRLLRRLSKLLTSLGPKKPAAGILFYKKLLAGSQFFLIAAFADAGIERDQAKRIHDRLAGVPPSETVLDAMEAAIIDNVDGEGKQRAAYIAMENPAFYAVTLKNLAAPWTNRDQDVFVPLNDYIATYIGLVRDAGDISENNSDFREILYGDVLYVGTSGAPYSNSNNANYENIEANNLDMGAVDASNLGIHLQRTTQSSLNGLPASATAGVMTSRAAARAFFIDGTNRAMFRYTMLNHLCYDMEQVKDTTRPADRIRQDISRSPGGDSRLFINGCVGCHSGMDPMAQAYAYYQWDYDGNADAGQLVFTDGQVQPKYFINATTFPHGYVTPDDRWDNFWREGVNKRLLGWDTNGQGALALPGSGNGAKTLGMELANSEAFARCHVQHAFETSCLRKPADANDINAIDSTVSIFKATNYNLKRVFAETASYCAVN